MKPLEREAGLELGGREDVGVSLDNGEETVGVLGGSFGDTYLFCTRRAGTTRVEVQLVS